MTNSFTATAASWEMATDGYIMETSSILHARGRGGHSAGTTKKAVAPTAPLFASRTTHTEMKLITVTAMVAPWPAMTILKSNKIFLN